MGGNPTECKLPPGPALDLQVSAAAKATEATASSAADIRDDGAVEGLASMAERSRLSRAELGGRRATSARICAC